MRRDRRWAAWPLAVLLGTALTLAPALGAHAYAVEGDATGGSTGVVEQGDPTGTPLDAEALAAAIDAGGEVTLTTDVTLGDLLDVTKDVTLDLNGFTLTGALRAKGANLTVIDSSKGQTGSMVDPSGEFPLVKGDGAMVVVLGGTFHVEPPEGFVPEGHEVIEKDGVWLVCAVSEPAHTHELAAHEETPATCTTSGTRAYWECLGCGGIFADVAATTEVSRDELGIAPAGHDLVPVQEVPSTCAAPGTAAHWICEGCGTLFGDDKAERAVAADELALPLAAHDLEYVPEVPSTCVQPGTAEHWRCSVCGERFADESGAQAVKLDELALPLGAHALEAVEEVPASCTEPGTAAHWACALCGKLFADEAGNDEVTAENLATALAPHSLAKVGGTPATCTERGVSDHWKCTVCGALFSEETGTTEVTTEQLRTALAPHALTGVAEVPATCEQTGVAAHWRCASCGGLFKDEEGTHPVSIDDLVVPLAAHKLTAHAPKAATCTEPGSLAHWTCEVCGKAFLDDRTLEPAGDVVVPATGHKAVHHERVAPTTKSAGHAEYWECSACGKLFSEEGMTKETTKDELALAKLGVFTVTFDDCLKGTEDVAYEVTEGRATPRPKDPSLKGWKFEGWYVYDGGWAREAYDFDAVVTEDLTLYAKWSELPDAEAAGEKDAEPTIPETGDDLNAAAPVAIALVGVAALAGTVIARRRARR
ncbi:InlB B-repeat-containing protein [Olsenella uli]|nr:InlB B-repeat-containing protein [Olsenella uli]